MLSIMEPVQIVLLLVIVILTVVLAVLAFQVFLILRDVRKTVEKTNKVLDDAGAITKSIAEPVSSLSSLFMGIKSGISFANWIKKTYSLIQEHLPHRDVTSSSEKKSEEVLESVDNLGGLDRNGQTNGTTHEEHKKSNKTESGSPRPIVRRFFKGIGRKIKIS
jgi:septation ring formation regulator EzrA